MTGESAPPSAAPVASRLDQGQSKPKFLSQTPLPVLQGLPLYALIDPFLGEPHLLAGASTSATDLDDLQAARRSAWKRAVWVARDPSPRVEADRMPYVVQLEGADDPLVELLVQGAAMEAQQASETSIGKLGIGALIETPLDGQRLMQRIEQMTTVMVRGRPRYLRLADPRVFELLVHLLSARHLAEWLGPVGRWHLRLRNGTWGCCLGLADDAFLSTEAELYGRRQRVEELLTKPARLLLSVEQEARLLDGEAVSLTLAVLQRELADVPDHAHEAAWTACEQAAAVGLTDLNDRVSYAWRAALGRPVNGTTRGREAIDAAKRNPGSLEERLWELDADSQQGTSSDDARA
ncbi:DUF4123 domain-containing protein [Caldimonas brevitalea]|uniref:DUF4123 domain-containing protein n=1 Tax=Caldimonas brevitalea TaxID=413882 RepID=A0A0G3BQS5_9BURK|nr:DUF4123 domain-containing protein [Caldimonas brevitalea]AKJ30328.1 hypothetical protein AAW51_3637 [Caldimonas brevitalea]